jgi:hypothetical protein
LKEQEGALGAKVDALIKEKDRALQSKHQLHSFLWKGSAFKHS